MPANRNYSFGEYTLDLKRGALLRAGADVRLRPKSYDVLRLLIERHGQLVSKEELLSAVWARAVVTDGAVTQCLIDVRRAIGDESQRVIRTVPRRGYIFDSPIVESEEVVRTGNGEAHDFPSTLVRAPVSRRNRALVPLALGLLALLAAGAWWVIKAHEQPATASRESPTPKTARNSIAVLPFVDLSPERDQEYFSDGISEEILNLLAQAPDLQVIARTSSFSFKGRNADIAEIAAKLNVAHVLEGSVRKSGTRVRITAQLVDAANSTHLWSQTYDRELEDAFAVQSEIATRVFEALRVTMMGKAIAPATAPDADAHEHFLRARFFYNRRAPGDIERAKEYYEQTLRIDPRYARAWAGLSGVYGVLLSTGNISPESGSAKRLEAAQRALALDPNLAEAHVRAAWHYIDVRDRRRAEEHARKAYAIDPDDPLVMTHFANVLAWEGRFDESLELLRRLAILDPISSLSHNVLASHQMAAGRYDEARAERLKELELNPAAKPDIDIDLGQIFILQRRFAEARELIEHWPAGDHRNQGLAIVEHALGRNAAAEAALHELTRGADPGAAVRVAEVYAQRGNVDEAFRWMETARARFGPDVWLTPEWRWAWQLRFSPFLRPLHGDPRWKATSSLLPPENSSETGATEARVTS